MQKTSARWTPWFICFLIGGAACVRVVWSQTDSPPAPLSPLRVTPEVCEKNGTVALTFTPPKGQRDTRLEVHITDAYRGGELAKARRQFRTAANGALTLSLSFRADAGIYAVQVYDRRDPLTEKAYFLVPGVDRVAREEERRRRSRRDDQDAPPDEKDEGWWLVNGYPVSGLLWNGSALPSEQPVLLRPTVQDGVGFNVATLVLSGYGSSSSGPAPGGQLEPQPFDPFTQQGTFAFLSLEPLLSVGLSGAHLAPLFNQRGEPQSAGCFNAPENRARLLDALRQMREATFGRGPLPQSFLGWQLVQPRLPDHTVTCYCSHCAQAFRAFLKERYGDVSKFNARHKMSVPSFLDVEPPRHPDMPSPSLWNDWQDFRFQTVPRFAEWLWGEMKKVFPERAVGYLAGSLLSLSQGTVAPGANPLEGVDELAWARSQAIDVLGVITSGEDAADRTDILVAAADWDADGYPNKPVWVTYSVPNSSAPSSLSRAAILSRVDAIAHGATGTFLVGADAALSAARDNSKLPLLKESADLNRFLDQYANLLTGARVIGEVGVVAPRTTLKYARDPQMVRHWEATFAGINAALQRAHRTKRIIFPERGITPRMQPSALIIPLGEMVSSAFLNQLKGFVEEGGSIYLEGLPLRDETGTVVGDRLKDLIGAEVEEVPRQASEMTVDNVWVFGTANKMRLPVQVRGKIKVIEKEVDAKDSKARERAELEKARIIATLPDGSPAVIARELGRERSLIRGTVIYTPNFVVRDTALAYLDRARRTRDTATPFDQRYVDYYGAIADYLLPPLVRIKGDDVGDLRVGALLSNANTLLIGFVNYGAARKGLELFVRTRVSQDDRDFREVNVYDMRAREWLEPLLPRTAVVRLRYDFPAHDWTFLAFTNHRRTDDFDKDVSEPRFKITVR